MSNRLQPVRGTKDITGSDYRLFDKVVQTAKEISTSYGYEGIITPIFEFTEVFKRTLGDTSDIVTKEMYSFVDQGGDSLTLRPEFTAGIARAFISGGMQQSLPCKLFSFGPLFRHERPQRGRYRQFNQINLEYLGIAEPYADVEVISLADAILKKLGLRHLITLELNSLGDDVSRNNYRTALVDYLNKHRDNLSEYSKQRLERNPMRVLDSKDEQDKIIVASAPSLHDYYSDTAKRFFEQVQKGLEQLNIDFKLNPKLVRGLDYYCHTAFEFTTTELGTQGTVMAGGRYDKLIPMMGGPETAAVGFGGGIERLMELLMLSSTLSKPRPIAILPLGEIAIFPALELANQLRSSYNKADNSAINIIVELIAGNQVGKQFKQADKLNASHALVIGENELNSKQVMLKNLDSGEQVSIPLDVAAILNILYNQ